MNINFTKKTTGALRLILSAVLAAITLLMVIPVCAHAPKGAGEPPQAAIEPIQIYDKKGDLLNISIDDVAAIHGDKCICVVGAFRVTQAAINVLYGKDEAPKQGNLTVVYHHPGIGHKQVFEHILTPEYVVYEKTGNPQYMTMDHWVYKFTRTDTGDVFETQIKEGMISKDFFALRYEVDGFEKGWHEDKPTDQEESGFAVAYTETLANLLTLPVWELYTGVEQPEESEEPAPVAAIIFCGALIILIVLGFIYSARVKRS